MRSEPHKIKVIRKIDFSTREQRVDALKAASFNTFAVPSGQITFDLTTQGTAAMSHDQYARMFVGDEAYAGSRSFALLEASAREVLGHEFLCPTHNLHGSIKLISTTMVGEGDQVIGNAGAPRELTRERAATFHELPTQTSGPFAGDMDPDELGRAIAAGPKTSYVYVETFADGHRPISLANLKLLVSIAGEHGTHLVLDASRVVENARYIRSHEPGRGDDSLASLVREITSMAHICILDAGQDARCNTGGLITTDNAELHGRYANEVVVYEGLHTYGGMAGRVLELLAAGLKEMVFENQSAWVEHQTELLADLVADLPCTIGANGVFVHADEFLPHVTAHQAQTLATALYLKSGARSFLQGRFSSETVLPIELPRLVLNDGQVTQLAQALCALYAERDSIPGLSLTNTPDWNDEAAFQWEAPSLGAFRFDCEPHVIHVFEYMGVTTRERRGQANREEGYNTFLLSSEDVGIDLLTDSGTCAMSTKQWNLYLGAVETPATSDAYLEFVDTVRDLIGYQVVIPTHQGRAAEHILSQIMTKGRFVPGNMYFTTTKLHQEMAGGEFVDIIVDDAHDPTSNFPWKGNIDLAKLDRLVQEHGADSIRYISFEMSVNMAGGQPFSMDNVKEVYAYCQTHGIPLMFDATRASENMYMIKKRDPRYHDVPVKAIFLEVFAHGDGVTWSSKKDPLVNIGGFQAFREDGLIARRFKDMLRKWEGTVTNGGLSAGDMVSQAEGLREMVNDDYIRTRVEQTQYLGNRLLKAGVPIINPPGGHAIFIDAARFLPHLDADEFPAQMLAASIFVECGVRTMERGNISKGRNPETGENYRPPLELVRVTIPRRTYTNSHMDTVADGIIALYERRHELKGLKFTYEAPVLRFFRSRFEEID